jgi:hypothetical protein
MKMKSITSVIATLAISFGLISPLSAAGLPDEQFVISGPQDQVPSLGVVIEDSQKLKNTFSTLQAFTSDGKETGKSNVTSVTNCYEYGSIGCESNKFFNFMANLGYCDQALTTDCVQAVTAADANGKPLQVNFIGAFPSKMAYAFKGDPKVNLPSGGSTFLVDIPEAKHAGGTQYLIVGQMLGRKDFDAVNFTTDIFSLGIFAVSKVSGRYQIAGPGTDVNFFRTLGMVSNFRIPFDKDASAPARCAQSSETECLLAWPMPLDIQFGLSVKAHSPVNGWLHGRTNNTTAEITKTSDGDQLIKVAGRASIVPSVYAWFPKSNLPKNVSDYYSTRPEELKQGTGFGTYDPAVGTGSSLLKDTFDYRENQFPEALAWYSALKDTAPMAPTQWSIRSTGSGPDQQGCFSNKLELSGIVATNSNFFISGPPTFNQSENSLDYKVASPHFLPNGDVFKGTYNLLMRSDVARCLYKFSNAPISASVSIVAADGTAQVATTVLGEKNGWLYLTASGFTFSSPTVRVKLTQAVEPTANPSPTAAAKPAVIKKSSITCVKGKTTKKVTSINPKCPTGYKKR